jgi:hypothetical protein
LHQNRESVEISQFTDEVSIKFCIKIGKEPNFLLDKIQNNGKIIPTNWGFLP